jgi:uncharacterized protein
MMPVDWFPDVPLLVLLLIPVVVTVGYAVFGATGFGSSLISVPFLAHWFPLTYVVPLLTTVDFVAVINASFRQWKHADFSEVRRVIPAMIVGMAAGTFLLFKLPREPALFVLGVFIAGYGLRVLFGSRPWRAVHPGWAWPIGFAGGVFGMLFGTGGPIYMVYLSARVHDKTVLRATSSIVVTIGVVTRVVVFLVTGLMLHASVLIVGAILVPLMFAGYWFGNRLHHALSRQGVFRLIALMLLVNGIFLVTRALSPVLP